MRERNSQSRDREETRGGPSYPPPYLSNREGHHTSPERFSFLHVSTVEQGRELLLPSYWNHHPGKIFSPSSEPCCADSQM